MGRGGERDIFLVGNIEIPMNSHLKGGKLYYNEPKQYGTNIILEALLYTFISFLTYFGKKCRWK